MSRRRRKRGSGRAVRELQKSARDLPNPSSDALMSKGQALPDVDKAKQGETMHEIESEEFEFQSEVTKVDDSLGLVFGWGIICKDAGQEYFDLQADSATETGMLEAAKDFMKKSRPANDMHRVDGGMVVFAFPMTSDIAKAFGFDTGGRTGLMVGVEPPHEIFEKFKSGDYTGFSIGGKVSLGGGEILAEVP